MSSRRGAHMDRPCPPAPARSTWAVASSRRRIILIYNALWQLPYSPVDFSGDPFWKEIQAMNAEGKLAPEHSRIFFPSTRPISSNSTTWAVTRTR